jgi:tetratricopeptide (TPR) repeat protein
MQRVGKAEAALRERGYTELPLLAWALLEKAGDNGGAPDMVARALLLAPKTPSVRFEAAKTLHNPVEFVRALLALPESLPALLWLITLLGAAIGLGLLVAAVAVVLAASGRVLPLQGHQLGHLTGFQDPPVWPGVLAALAVLALLPRMGLGLFVVLGAAGLLAALRLRVREGAYVASALLIMGLLAGPLLDQWARFVAFPGQHRGLFAAWRVDQAQPMPGDRERLERELARHPQDAFLHLALAMAWQREGEFARVEALLDRFPEAAPAPLKARASNLRGMVHLARGHLDPALRAFETAQSIEESAPILYNLSQAHGRALRLINQTNYFKRARELDPELIHERTLAQSDSVHRYLIHDPIPFSAYLKHGLRQSPEAQGVVREARRWMLGSRTPDWAWLALPAMGLLGLIFRRSSIGRCECCTRPICSYCAPGASRGAACVHCAGLAPSAGQSDARLQKRRVRRGRNRERRIELTLAGAGLLIPGVAGLREGRLQAGAVRIFLAATGFAFLILADRMPFAIPAAIPAPFEVGGLGVALPLLCALMLLAPLYVWGFLVLTRRLAVAKKPA